MSKSMLGQTINNQYLLTDVLGEGGMGIVFKAEDQNLNNRLCAIKLLKGQTTDPNEAKRFEAELQIISRLRSPHVVQVLNKGYFEGHRLYIVMELLEGEALSSLIKKTGAFEIKRAIQITKGILAGLSEAHDYGVVHRDLKPANIFITRSRAGDEITKVLDFGIAKDTNKDDNSGLTSASMIIGTPKYMAPEQFMKSDTDQRTDLYAVGLLLYQMLCGTPPYVADSDLVPETLKTMPSEFKVGWLHLNAEPKPLDVFPPLWELCRRLLKKQAEDRPNSAAEVIAELNDISERITSGSNPYVNGQNKGFAPASQHNSRPSGPYLQPAQAQQQNLTPTPPSGPQNLQSNLSRGLGQLGDPSQTTGLPSGLKEQGLNTSKRSKKKLVYIVLFLLVVAGTYLASQKNLGGSKTRKICYHKFKVSPPGPYKLSKTKLKDRDGQLVKSSFEQPLGQTNQNGSLATIIQLTCGEEWQIKAQRKGFKEVLLLITELDDSKTHTHQIAVTKEESTTLKVNSIEEPAKTTTDKNKKRPHHKASKTTKSKAQAKDKIKKSSWRKKRQQDAKKSSHKAKRHLTKKVKPRKEKSAPKIKTEPKTPQPKKQEVPNNNASPGLMF